MNVSEIFNIANNEYQNIENIIKNLGNLVKKSQAQYSVEQSLFDFDLILQCILFRTAIIDGIFDNNEKVFIDSITQRGDVLVLLSREKNVRLSWDSISYLSPEQMMNVSDMIEDSVVKYANNFIIPFATLDAIFVEKNILDDLVKHIDVIVRCFADIDGITHEEELQAAIKQTRDILIKAWLVVKQRAVDIAKSSEPKCSTKTESSLKDLYHPKKISINYKTQKLLNYCNEKNNVPKSVVYIETNTGTGTGFIITNDGFIVTCAHVVSEAREIYVKVNKENEQFEVTKASLIAIDTNIDIAIIKIEQNEFLYYLEIDIDRQKPNLGEEIVIYGYPFGSRMSDKVSELNISFAKGYVSSNQIESGIRKTFLDISAKAGNSGSPIISAENGKVLGVLAGSIVCGQQQNEEINYMIPIEYIKQFFEN